MPWNRYMNYAAYYSCIERNSIEYSNWFCRNIYCNEIVGWKRSDATFCTFKSSSGAFAGSSGTFLENDQYESFDCGIPVSCLLEKSSHIHKGVFRYPIIHNSLIISVLYFNVPKYPIYCCVPHSVLIVEPVAEWVENSTKYRTRGDYGEKNWTQKTTVHIFTKTTLYIATKFTCAEWDQPL